MISYIEIGLYLDVLLCEMFKVPYGHYAVYAVQQII